MTGLTLNRRKLVDAIKRDQERRVRDRHQGVITGAPPLLHRSVSDLYREKVAGLCQACPRTSHTASSRDQVRSAPDLVRADAPTFILREDGAAQAFPPFASQRAGRRAPWTPRGRRFAGLTCASAPAARSYRSVADV